MKPILPLNAEAVRLEHGGPSFLERLGSLDSTSIRARNPGAELTKQVVRMEPISAIDADDPPAFAVAPELGLVFSLETLEAAHGFIPRRTEEPSVVELDFAGQPNGLSFTARPGTPAAASVADLVRECAIGTVAFDALETWREHLQVPIRMCPCCARAAVARMQRPKAHPAYGILQQAVSVRQPLYCRLRGTHGDLTAWLVASRLDAENGWIRCGDAGNGFRFSAGFCHKVVLSRESWDGEAFTVARLFDSRGIELLQFGARGAHHGSVWAQAVENCESGEWGAAGD